MIVFSDAASAWQWAHQNAVGDCSMRVQSSIDGGRRITWIDEPWSNAGWGCVVPAISNSYYGDTK